MTTNITKTTLKTSPNSSVYNVPIRQAPTRGASYHGTPQFSRQSASDRKPYDYVTPQTTYVPSSELRAPSFRSARPSLAVSNRAPVDTNELFAFQPLSNIKISERALKAKIAYMYEEDEEGRRVKGTTHRASVSRKPVVESAEQDMRNTEQQAQQEQEQSDQIHMVPGKDVNPQKRHRKDPPTLQRSLPFRPTPVAKSQIRPENMRYTKDPDRGLYLVSSAGYLYDEQYCNADYDAFVYEAERPHSTATDTNVRGAYSQPTTATSTFANPRLTYKNLSEVPGFNIRFDYSSTSQATARSSRWHALSPTVLSPLQSVISESSYSLSESESEYEVTPESSERYNSLRHDRLQAAIGPLKQKLVGVLNDEMNNIMDDYL